MTTSRGSGHSPDSITVSRDATEAAAVASAEAGEYRLADVLMDLPRASKEGLN